MLWGLAGAYLCLAGAPTLIILTDAALRLALGIC